MPDDFVELIVASALDATADKAARRHRWVRIVQRLMQVFLVLLLLLVVVVTFAYW